MSARIGIAFVAIMAGILTYSLIMRVPHQYFGAPSQVVAPGPVEGVEPVPMVVVPQETSEGFVKRVMGQCKVKQSTARQAILASQLARIVDDTFKDRLQGEAFVALVCIESRFDQSAKSTAGAIGVAQLMPQFVAGFSQDCGYGEIAGIDAHDTEVNLRLGACLFRSLLETYQGNTALALAAYNSGADSSTVKKLKQLGTGAEETSGYLAKHYVLTEKLKASAEEK